MLLTILSALANTEFKTTSETSVVFVDNSKLQMCIPLTETTIVSSVNLCELCEITVKDLQDVLSDESSKQEIIDALELLCQGMGHAAEELCDMLVSYYFPQLINRFLKMEPRLVCTRLRVC